MKGLFSLFGFFGIISAVISQEPCSPLDPGEWIPVKPVLYLSVYEATERDLLLYPHDIMYQGELRINGLLDINSPNGINLEPQQNYLLNNPAEIFTFESVGGKNIARLIKPLDRDGPTESVDDDVSVITFTLKCSPVSNDSIEIFYDVSVLIKDRNDNPPEFIDTPHQATIGELTPIGSTVITVSAIDKDSNLDGNITFSIVKNSGVMNDGGNLFNIDPFQGHIKVQETLDFEGLGIGHKYHNVRVLVEDGGPDMIMSAYTDVRINVIDGNDNGPSFLYSGCIEHRLRCIVPRYTADVNSIVLNEEIRLRSMPDTNGNNVNIVARDFDGIPSDITLLIAATQPKGYDSFFSVETRKDGDNFQAIVKQTRSLEFPVDFEVLLKAEEMSPERYFEIAVIRFVGQTTSNNGQTTTTQSSVGTTAPLTSERTGESSSTEEFSQTTVALIVVVAVTLTLVVCLAVAMVCAMKRRQPKYDKTPLTSVNGAHDNRAYSAQL